MVRLSERDLRTCLHVVYDMKALMDKLLRAALYGSEPEKYEAARYVEDELSTLLP